MVSMGVEATVSEELHRAMLEDGFEPAETSSRPAVAALRPMDVIATSLRGKEVINAKDEDLRTSLPGDGCGFTADGQQPNSPCGSSDEVASVVAEEAELAVEKVQIEVAGSEVLSVVGAGISSGASGTAAVIVAASATSWKLPFQTAVGLRTLAILAASVTGLTTLVRLMISALQGSSLKPGSMDKPV